MSLPLFMIKIKPYRYCVLLILCCFTGGLSFAQSQLERARTYYDNRDYQPAANVYKELFAAQPGNTDIYQEYFSTLLQMKDWDKAEAVVKEELKRRGNHDPLLIIDLGRVYRETGKTKKAEEQFEQVVQMVNGDDIQTQRIANALSVAGQENTAIKVYEKAAQLMGIPALYNHALARLYRKAGNIEKAIQLSIENVQSGFQQNGDETIEATLLEIIGDNAGYQQEARKTIVKLVNQQPDNFYYTQLLIWIFSLQDNWEPAFVQVKALEKRSVDKGRLMYNFAMSAAQKGKYDIAGQALDEILAYGVQQPFYRIAREARLKYGLQQVEQSLVPEKQQIETLSAAYARFLTDYPDAIVHPVINDYARLEAQYADRVDTAIALLQQALHTNRGDKFFTGNTKLQLGDYYVLKNDIWEAALLYAQVDKAFREDVLGEEARFRNARLAYYANDFEQAQAQLAVLKASTSELIANDAMYLSVLITENIPADSNLVPLQRFAFADLLLFQNKDREAEVLLDSIATVFPEHPLADDILMLRSKIMLKHKQYQDAVALLKKIIEQHGKDVLADDATFQIAEIYRKYLYQEAEAKNYYEQLIIDYPGSSFITQARNQLSKPATPVVPRVEKSN